MTKFYNVGQTTSNGGGRLTVTFRDGTGRPVEAEVSEEVRELLEDLQREHWRLERRESRRASHLEMMPAWKLPIADFSADPGEIVVREHDGRRLIEALRGIPETQSRRFLLRYYLCLPLARIASMEGCSTRAVSYSLALARKKLREYLSE